MFKTIGLTGSIATGKSTASKFLQELGCTVIDGDVIAREVVEDRRVLKTIEEAFGNEVLDGEGKLRRKKLGEQVFNNEDALKKLNEITHPAIRSRIKDRLKALRTVAGENKNLHCVAIDGALLIEMNLHRWVDEVWVVALPEKEQIARLMARDGISESDARKRIEAQMSTEEKIKYADVVLDNTGDPKYLQVQIKNEMDRLKHQ
ncbi:dephospho-CoA kinase [Isachenkonia alkalipeptolytica]|uniref:Dephospho-CoA kinase n=1 Tax=Isachenkonia alkalipeptolytica TaxID=2565777 RepID=A0AA43XJE0_9CLOT|nr:dephospho-CoA kinase [Isachenkonia alkalipeptolytica]NBG87918.1 dephospho-CoA kinase [Isachenkonia alkalipeptolytica]